MSSLRLHAYLALVVVMISTATGQSQNRNLGSSSDLPRVRTDIHNGAVNSLWKYDAYPDLQSLDAHKTVTIAELKGPAPSAGWSSFLEGWMEANNEYRVDSEREPSINYLGSECAFNFGWGWQTLFNGYKVGGNFLDPKAGETAVSTFRFRDRDVIRFRKKLGLTLDWSHEFKTIPRLKEFRDRVERRNAEGGGWVDYSETTYWYSLHAEGPGVPLPTLGERLKPIHPNSRTAGEFDMRRGGWPEDSVGAMDFSGRERHTSGGGFGNAHPWFQACDQLQPDGICRYCVFANSVDRKCEKLRAANMSPIS